MSTTEAKFVKLVDTLGMEQVIRLLQDKFRNDFDIKYAEFIDKRNDVLSGDPEEIKQKMDKHLQEFTRLNMINDILENVTTLL
jgi:hypothetical protein